MLGEISKAIGEQSAIGLGNDLAAKDPGLGAAILVGAAQTSTGRYTSELVLLGQQRARDEGRNGKGEIQDKVRKEVAEVVGAAMRGPARNGVIEAAAYIAMGMEAEGGGRDVKRAVRLAIGGDIIKFNGSPIPVPAGFTEEKFSESFNAAAAQAIRAVPAGSLTLAGQPVDADRLLAGAKDVTLEWAGSGRYFMRAAGAAVYAGNAPLVVEVQ